MLRFSDGEQFDTQSKPHLEKRYDGWYFVGNGMLIPIKDEEEGKKYLKKYKK